MRRWPTKVFTVAAFLGAVSMFAAMSLFTVSNWWVHRIGHPARFDALSDVPPHDVAIVPGIGARFGNINDHLRSRLLAAIALYRAHKVKDILVSGVGREPGMGDEVVSSRSWLVAHGVDPAHIISDPAGFRTLETMQRAAHAYHVTSAVICSQAPHLDRSLFLARSAGIDAVGFTASMRREYTSFEERVETLKATLAFLDIYVIHTSPRVTEPVGLVAAAP
ncbi:MAG TPA: ElyC/SanA/YdcF family protein [Polyangia bacterium]|jgi:SanA protein